GFGWFASNPLEAGEALRRAYERWQTGAWELEGRNGLQGHDARDLARAVAVLLGS
ncbi:MAG: hypothetical protein JO302_06740, partial [Candidatus Eremiobacteraeota bacterium]|nr:hypothetical protein [Candidatus Eremiobacteraeota bacterium]